MFAALTVARLREAVFMADTDAESTVPLRKTASWISPDFVPASKLPLAKATEKVLASMHGILEKTMIARDAELAQYPPDDEDKPAFPELDPSDRQIALEKRNYLRRTKAAEVRLIRNVSLLKKPEVDFRAEEWAPQ